MLGATYLKKGATASEVRGMRTVRIVYMQVPNESAEKNPPVWQTLVLCRTAISKTVPPMR